MEAATQARNVENRIAALETLGQHGRLPSYWREPLALAFAVDEIAAEELLTALRKIADAPCHRPHSLPNDKCGECPACIAQEVI